MLVIAGIAKLKLPRPRNGFAQRTFTSIYPTRYFPPISLGKWRSPVNLNLIKRDLMEFNNNTKMPDDFALKCAIAKARQAFKLPQPVKMLHLNDVFKKDLDIWNKSPGLPWKDLGYKTKGNVRDDPNAVRSVRKFWHFIKNGDQLRAPDCCAYVRSHIADYPEQKVRAVWGYPATVTFGEAVFAVPLIKAYQAYPSPIAYGYETACGGMKRLHNTFSLKHKYGLDFSKFDKTVPAWLIRIAFSILLDNLDLMHYQGYGTADVTKTLRMFKYIEEYFIRTPVRLANGERYLKTSGVASGSYFTQLIDSIVNYIILLWLCFDQGITPGEMKVLGDDSIFETHKELDMERCTELITSIGMKLNLEKSGYSTNLGDLSFLGYKINDGIPTKPLEDWLASLVYPEQPDRDYDDFASRVLGLFYANASVNSTFDIICRTILRRPFKMKLSLSMERMLLHTGVVIEKELPSPFQFWRKLCII